MCNLCCRYCSPCLYYVWLPRRTLHQCCNCYSLRVGAVMFAILFIVLDILFLAGALRIALVVPQESIKEPNDPGRKPLYNGLVKPLYNGAYIFYYIIAALFFLWTILDILLLIGAIAGSLVLLSAWILLSLERFIHVLLDVVAIIVGASFSIVLQDGQQDYKEPLLLVTFHFASLLLLTLYVYPRYIAGGFSLTLKDKLHCGDNDYISEPSDHKTDDLPKIQNKTLACKTSSAGNQRETQTSEEGHALEPPSLIYTFTSETQLEYTTYESCCHKCQQFPSPKIGIHQEIHSLNPPRLQQENVLYNDQRRLCLPFGQSDNDAYHEIQDDPQHSSSTYTLSSFVTPEDNLYECARQPQSTYDIPLTHTPPPTRRSPNQTYNEQYLTSTLPSKSNDEVNEHDCSYQAFLQSNYKTYDSGPIFKKAPHPQVIFNTFKERSQPNLDSLRYEIYGSRHCVQAKGSPLNDVFDCGDRRQQYSPNPWPTAGNNNKRYYDNVRRAQQGFEDRDKCGHLYPQNPQRVMYRKRHCERIQDKQLVSTHNDRRHLYQPNLRPEVLINVRFKERTPLPQRTYERCCEHRRSNQQFTRSEYENESQLQPENSFEKLVSPFSQYSLYNYKNKFENRYFQNTPLQGEINFPGKYGSSYPSCSRAQPKIKHMYNVERDSYRSVHNIPKKRNQTSFHRDRDFETFGAHLSPYPSNTSYPQPDCDNSDGDESLHLPEHETRGECRQTTLPYLKPNASKISRKSRLQNVAVIHAQTNKNTNINKMKFNRKSYLRNKQT